MPLVLLCAALAACGGESGDTSPTAPAPTVAPQQSPAATASPSVGNLVATAAGVVAFDFSPDGRIFFTERTTGEIRTARVGQAVSPELLALPQVDLAREAFADEAGLNASEIVVISVAEQQWPDACLGLAGQGEICAAVVTPGYEIVVGAAEGGAATYRTDQGAQVRLEDIGAVASGSDLFATVDVFHGSECGLLGIAVDPEFEINGYVYVYATQPIPGDETVGKPRVIRYTDVDGQGTDPIAIVDDLPTTNPDTCAHVGGNVHFGPDGFLYLSVGNNERNEEAVAQDLASPLGKILRMTRDGSAAPGNPFENDPDADPRVYAYGLRNPFDFAFHPQTGMIYAPDNGPGNCDELNIIVPGGDYGVPGSLPADDVESCFGLGGIDPIYTFAVEDLTAEQFGSNLAPAGVAFLDGSMYPSLGEGLLVCFFNSGRLHHLTLGGPDFDTVEEDRDIAPCRPNVKVHDGLIYYASDDGIYELPPDAVQ